MMGEEDRGKVVRTAFTRWARTLASPKASWLVEWDDSALPAEQREVDTLIYDAVVATEAFKRHMRIPLLPDAPLDPAGTARQCSALRALSDAVLDHPARVATAAMLPVLAHHARRAASALEALLAHHRPGAEVEGNPVCAGCGSIWPCYDYRVISSDLLREDS
jgi:hypothetical protein